MQQLTSDNAMSSSSRFSHSETGSRIHAFGLSSSTGSACRNRIKDPCLSVCHPELVEGSLVSHLNSQKGFALLLTLIVIGVIGAVAFGVGYLTLHSYSATVRFQDSQSALQAAEAGIEDGLVRFRYDRNTEVPTAAMCAALPNPTILPADQAEPTDTTKFVLRVNLTTKDDTQRLLCLDPTKTPTPNPSDIVYDLKVSYKGSKLGEFGSTDLASSQSTPTINKDDLIEISGFSNPSSINLLVQYKMIQEAASPPSVKRAVIEFLDKNGQSSQISQPIIVNKIDEFDFNASQGSSIGLTSDVAAIRIRPIAGNAKIAAKISGTAKPIDFGISSFESTGYSNGVKRRLASSVNRSTGKTTGVYNFVLFSGVSNAELKASP